MKHPEKTKYQNARQYLLEYIRTNKLKKGDKLPTEQQLTERLGVSRITVRKAVADLAERGIVKRIQGSGTYLNKTEESHEKATYIPIVLCGTSESVEFYDIIMGAEKVLNINSFYLSIHFSHRSIEEEQRIVRRLYEDGSRHIMIFPCDAAQNCHFFFKMQQAGVHFVFIDRMPPNMTGNLVISDNVTGGYLAVRHLLDNGYRRIAYISIAVESEAYTITQRLDGYCNALTEAGIALNSDYISFPEMEGDASARIQRLLELPEPPEAIFCANDLMAVELMKYCHRMSIRVPGDLAVVGYDNMPILQNLPYSITTIEQDFYRMGYEAAKTICDIIKGNTDMKLQKVLPVRLLVRDSSASIHQYK